jgi:hypothetical protein
VVSYCGREIMIWEERGIQRGKRHSNGLSPLRRFELESENDIYLPLPNGSHILIRDNAVVFESNSFAVHSLLDYQLLISSNDVAAWEMLLLTGTKCVKLSLPDMRVLSEQQVLGSLGNFFCGRDPKIFAVMYDGGVVRFYSKDAHCLAERTLIIDDEVREVRGIENKLILRTARSLLIYHISIVDLQLICSGKFELPEGSPIDAFPLDTGTLILAIGQKNHLHVYATISPRGTIDECNWTEIYSQVFSSDLSTIHWTHGGNIVLFTITNLIFVSPSPFFTQKAMDAQNFMFYDPCVLREWLRWDQPKYVEAIFNHLYYTIKHGIKKVPLILWETLKQSSGVDKADLGAELEALFSNEVNLSAKYASFNLIKIITSSYDD